MGGNFNNVNGASTNQWNLTRFNISSGSPATYALSPMYSSAQNIYGVNGIIYTINVSNVTSGEMYCGGAFSDFVSSTGSSILSIFNLFRVVNSQSSSGTQAYDYFQTGPDTLSTNGTVYSSVVVSNVPDYILFGGDFTNVSGVTINYCALWILAPFYTWVSIDGNNFNGSVRNLVNSAVYSGQIVATGLFNQSGLSYGCYINATNPIVSGSATSLGQTLTVSSNIGCLRAMNGRDILTTDSLNVYVSSAPSTWVSKGQSADPSIYSPAGIMITTGLVPVAIYTNYNRPRQYVGP
jgi:hypothetical protein